MNASETIRAHCCGADMFFDDRKAAKEYRQYLKRGARRATAALIRQLASHNWQGKTLVDVGGGIGALQWWFLQQGGAETYDIDASTGYLEQAREHARQQGWSKQAHFVAGNWTEVGHQVPDPDLVTLDKVVCCYPDYREILETSCRKARKCVALSYPLDGWLARGVRGILALFLQLQGNPFRPYIHPVREIRAIMARQGFIRQAHNLVFPWHVETYCKNP